MTEQTVIPFYCGIVTNFSEALLYSKLGKVYPVNKELLGKYIVDVGYNPDKS